MITTLLEPTVTKRAMIDPLRKCSLRCDFCYYLHGDMESVRPWAAVEKDVRDAASRGCNACDITGGEPMQYVDIVKLVALCVECGVMPRIITSLIGPEKHLDGCLNAGVADWLISMHGAKEETHNAIVHVPNARKLQIRRLEKISARMRYCCNYVMIADNQTEMDEWAQWVVSRERLPRVVNFINFNPHYEWRRRPETAELIVDLAIAGPILDAAIDTLEAAGVGVNVRYFPMCALRDDHRRCVCNDLHVAFDSGEWDNAITHRTEHGARVYGERLSQSNEEKGQPCNRCDAQWICGGANKHWHAASQQRYGEQLVPLSLPGAGPKDFYHYRQHNAAGMA